MERIIPIILILGLSTTTAIAQHSRPSSRSNAIHLARAAADYRQADPQPNVAIIHSDDINDAGNKRLPRFVPMSLTTAELATVSSQIKNLPDFPPNPYSGCHARAHMVYQALNKASGKLFKVWLLSGSLVSPALKGSIGFSIPSGDETSWEYHVAAAYVDESRQTWVLDTLVSRDPLPVTSWLRSFKLNGLVLYVQMPGEIYLFNKSDVPALDSKYPDGLRQHILARNILNGNFYPYSGKTQEDHLGAQDLAADAVASFLIDGKKSGCFWSGLAKSTLKLKGEILKPEIPRACESARALYRTEYEKWVNLGL